MSGPERPIPLERRAEARRWLVIVDEDIDVAIAASRIQRPGASAYHVQQAAEKLVKALLVLAGEAFRRTHDMDDLLAPLLRAYPAFAGYAEVVRPLSIWGVAYRYPGLAWKMSLSHCLQPRNWTTSSRCLGNSPPPQGPS